MRRAHLQAWRRRPRHGPAALAAARVPPRAGPGRGGSRSSTADRQTRPAQSRSARAEKGKRWGRVEWAKDPRGGHVIVGSRNGGCGEIKGLCTRKNSPQGTPGRPTHTRTPAAMQADPKLAHSPGRPRQRSSCPPASRGRHGWGRTGCYASRSLHERECNGGMGGGRRERRRGRCEGRGTPATPSQVGPRPCTPATATPCRRPSHSPASYS